MNLLFSANNPQQLANVIPVVKRIMQIRPESDVEFLDMDSIYKQNIVKIVEEFKTTKLDFGGSTPFYLQSGIKRIISQFSFSKNLRFEKHYDILILGALGILEYKISRILRKKFGTKVYFIQDAILLRPESYVLRKKLRSIFYGCKPRHRVCEKVFSSGEVTKESQMIDGVEGNRIIVSGIPRFNYLFRPDSVKVNDLSGKLKILYLTCAFRYHGHPKFERYSAIFFDNLKKIASQFKDSIEIEVRKHPRDDQKYSESVFQIIDPKSESLFESVSRNDVVLSATSPSTVLFETKWMGKNVCFVETCPVLNKMFCVKEFRDAVDVISPEQLQTQIEYYIKNRGQTGRSKELKSFFISEKCPYSEIDIAEIILKDAS